MKRHASRLLRGPVVPSRWLSDLVFEVDHAPAMTHSVRASTTCARYSIVLDKPSRFYWHNHANPHASSTRKTTHLRQQLLELIVLNLAGVVSIDLSNQLLQ